MLPLTYWKFIKKINSFICGNVQIESSIESVGKVVEKAINFFLYLLGNNFKRRNN